MSEVQLNLFTQGTVTMLENNQIIKFIGKHSIEIYSNENAIH